MSEKHQALVRWAMIEMARDHYWRDELRSCGRHSKPAIVHYCMKKCQTTYGEADRACTAAAEILDNDDDTRARDRRRAFLDH